MPVKPRGPYQKRKPKSTEPAGTSPGGVSAETARKCFKELVSAVRALRDPSASLAEKRAACDDYLDTSLEMLGEKWFGRIKYVEEINAVSAIVIRGGFAAYEHLQGAEETVTTRKVSNDSPPRPREPGLGKNDVTPSPALPPPAAGS
jgi:hypothetical protein